MRNPGYATGRSNATQKHLKPHGAQSTFQLSNAWKFNKSLSQTCWEKSIFVKFQKVSIIDDIL